MNFDGPHQLAHLQSDQSIALDKTLFNQPSDFYACAIRKMVEGHIHYNLFITLLLGSIAC